MANTLKQLIQPLEVFVDTTKKTIYPKKELIDSVQKKYETLSTQILAFRQSVVVQSKIANSDFDDFSKLSVNELPILDVVVNIGETGLTVYYLVIF
jgi:hypothetical protein